MVGGACGGRPNAEIQFDPALGFNSGALTLRATSQNLSGISAKKEILINRGVHHVGHSGTVRGPLDVLFAKYESNPVENTPADGGGKEKVLATTDEGVPGPSVFPGEGATAAAETLEEVPQAAAASAWRAEINEPPFSAFLHEGTLMLESSAKANKKIMKNFLVHEWLDGEVFELPPKQILKISLEVRLGFFIFAYFCFSFN